MVAGAIDFVIMLTAMISEISMNAGAFEAMTAEGQNVMINELVNKYTNAGFGGAADLLIFAPIMLLFNYSKTYKHTEYELAIPVVFVVILMVIYLEAGLVGLGMLASIVEEKLGPEIEEMMMLLEAYEPEGEKEGGGEFSDADLAMLLAVLQGEEPPSGATATEGPSLQKDDSLSASSSSSSPDEKIP